MSTFKPPYDADYVFTEDNPKCMIHDCRQPSEVGWWCKLHTGLKAPPGFKV